MSRIGYPVYNEVFRGADSSQTATYNSNPNEILCLASISLSLETVNTSASLWTVQLSNANGFNAAIRSAEWSNATTLVAAGFYTIDPGARWLRVQRSSLESTATLVLSGWAS